MNGIGIPFIDPVQMLLAIVAWTLVLFAIAGAGVACKRLARATLRALAASGRPRSRVDAAARPTH